MSKVRCAYCGSATNVLNAALLKNQITKRLIYFCSLLHRGLYMKQTSHPEKYQVWH